VVRTKPILPSAAGGAAPCAPTATACSVTASGVLSEERAVRQVGGVVPGNGDGTFRTPTDVQYDPLESEDIYVQVDLAQGLATDLFRDGRPSLVTVGRAGTGSGPFGQLKVFRPGRAAP
jgi:hypothetical protein